MLQFLCNSLDNNSFFLVFLLVLLQLSELLFDAGVVSFELVFEPRELAVDVLKDFLEGLKLIGQRENLVEVEWDLCTTAFTCH
jgi:hypothetical protein